MWKQLQSPECLGEDLRSPFPNQKPCQMPRGVVHELGSWRRLIWNTLRHSSGVSTSVPWGLPTLAAHPLGETMKHTS